MKGTRIMASGFFIAAAVVFLMTFSGVSAQAPVPAPSPTPTLDCLTNLLNMSDCLTYVEADSNLTVPDKGCCPELAGLVESSPICLCQLLGNTVNIGVEINVSKALILPSICRVSTPSVSLCAVLGVPVSVPTASEGPIAPGASSPGGVAPSTGSGTANTPGGGSSSATSIRDFALVFLIGLSSVAVAIFI